VSLAAVLLLRLATVSAGTGIALAFPLDRSLVVRVYLLVVCGLALETLVRAAAGGPSSVHERRRRTDNRDRPEALVRLEDQVALAVATAADLHFHLRPVLREIAVARGGVDEASAGAAWEVVRPDREPPRDAFARGMSTAQLTRVVDALENL
jgi:hypothetical protein